MEKITEIRNDYVDDQNLCHIDCWFTDDDDEEGRTVAVVDLDTNKVIFFDNRLRGDKEVKIAIEEVLAYENNIPKYSKNQVIKFIYNVLEATGKEIHAEMKKINTKSPYIEFRGSDVSAWIENNVK